MTVGELATTGLIGVGYEGRTIGAFIDELLADSVTHLIDVRMTPISRKPGFSKTALSRALAEAKIAYDHRPELGNPKANRAGFGGSEAELATARNVFAQWIQQPAAESALDSIASLSQRARVALLCFEADEERCHRHVVLEQVEQRSPQRLG